MVDANANVVITGASRGIGLALARQYIENGDRVFAACRTPESAHKLAELAKASDGRLTLHQLDIGDEASIAAFGREIDQPIDILINNAGIIGGERQTLDDMDYDAWLHAFGVMTLGPFRVVKALLDQLGRAGNAKIMTVSSQLAASTWPYGGNYIYCSAKAAGNRVMQILAIDLKDRGISVGSIHPGYVKTDMGGAGADISPEESAAGIRAVTAGLTLGNSGKFWKWNGEEHPL